jgi:hypothetical protein
MPSDDEIRASRFPRIIVVKQKCPMASMLTRRKNERNTITQDAIWMATRKAKWTHEFNTKMNLREYLRQFFWHAKDFEPTHEVPAEARKTLPAVKRTMKMHSRMVGCIHDHTRI